MGPRIIRALFHLMFYVVNFKMRLKFKVPVFGVRFHSGTMFGEKSYVFTASCEGLQYFFVSV